MLLWAVGSVLGVALAVVAVIGWTNPRMLSFVNPKRMPLPVASNDENVRIELRTAIEAFYEGELDVARRGVDKVLRASVDEPGALVLKAALAGRVGDKHARGEALRELGRLLAEGLPASCLGDAELVRAVLASATETAEGVRREWEGCSTCRSNGFGHLLFSGLLADRFAHDRELGTLIAKEARRLLPRSALPVADHARFVLSSGDDGHAREALAIVDEGLAINPHSPVLHQVKAEVLLALERYDDAERELREVLSMSTTPDATALLAQVLLLRGDEEGRRDVVQAALRRSTAEAHAALASHHASALIGAGRVREALAMFHGALAACVKAGTPSSLAAASLVALDALRASDAAHVGAELEGLKEATAELLKHIHLPGEQADVTRWVLHLVEGVLAADRGEHEVARHRLEQLERASSDKLPPQAHQGILAYLAYRVHLAGGEKLDEAERAASHLAHPCAEAEAKARLAAARGNTEEARRAFQRLVERERYCRLYTHGGAHVLNARAALVMLDAEAGKLDEARRGLEALLAAYPKADENLYAIRQARAALGQAEPEDEPSSQGDASSAR